MTPAERQRRYKARKEMRVSELWDVISRMMEAPTLDKVREIGAAALAKRDPVPQVDTWGLRELARKKMDGGSKA